MHWKTEERVLQDLHEECENADPPPTLRVPPSDPYKDRPAKVQTVVASPIWFGT